MTYDPPIDPSQARIHYANSLKQGVIYLTSHSHRLWPDAIAEGQMLPVHLAWDLVDEKWGPIFGEIIPLFQGHVAQRIEVDSPKMIARGENTHDLVTRVLSCFPWDQRTKIVTTEGEFDSMTRQLLRLKEEGVGINFVSVDDHESLSERMCTAIDEKTNVVFVSTVLFMNSYVVQNLAQIINKARTVGATVILDSYHQFNALRTKVDELGKDIFVTAGGYKYASGGEGGAWLKVPECCTMRPRITGWFAHFESLGKRPYPSPVEYQDDAFRFWGATLDISGMCRQNAVFNLMNKLGWTTEVLERNVRYQMGVMIGIYDSLKLENSGIYLVSSRDPVKQGPFLALNVQNPKRATHVVEELKNRKIHVDSRDSIIRVGAGPYTLGEEIEQGLNALAEIAGKTL